MSASREKKIRRELAEQGIPDIKEIRAAEERKQQRRANILYGSIAAIFVVVAAALLIWNSNVIQRSSTAISVDGEKYSAAEVGYFYHNAIQSAASSQYASYLSLDTSTSLTQQVMTDMDLMFIGAELPEGKEEMTWHEFFMDTAKDELVLLTMAKKGALDAGMTFTEEMQAEADASLEAIGAAAAANGMTTSAYLKALFGSNITEKIFTDLLKDSILASHFQRDYVNSLQYTADDLQKYYEENKDAFDVVNYEYIYFKGVAPSTTDAEGNTVAATDEENAAAKAAAEKAANESLTKYQSGELLEKIAKGYDIATYYNVEEQVNYNDTLGKWLFDDERQAGDVEVLNSGSTYYLVVFHDRYRQDYNTINVRHILAKVDSSELDTEAEDYQTQLQVLIDEQEARAESILNEWKSGAATEESFAELASKSDDTGSVANGGLYEQVAKGDMVQPFEDWCFDENRKAGDTDIVFVEATNYTGFHVMYFVGEDAPYWELQVTNTMTNQDYAQWLSSLIEGIEAEEHSGMKYVG